ncbi:MAG: winged helix-turn-helix transcriptional regulator [Nanoarchaeota archaeon]|nr:winged helix-turn-helix transcriptional regulator [Nanoarchaeota archaeon]
MLKKLIIVLMLLILIENCYAATIYGNIYDPDLNQMKGRIEVEVDSSPRQYRVSTDGTYSFFLLVGKYTIKAKYEEHGRLKYIAEERIVVRDEGRFIHDIVMYPSPEEEERLMGDVIEEPSNKNNSIVLFMIIGFVFIVSILLVFYILKKTRKKEYIQEKKEESFDETKEEKEDIENPESLDTIIKIIKENKGRITQREIRKQIPLSEAKISLMITELEDKGIVKRIKKGRGNIIILNKKFSSDRLSVI